MAHGNSISPLIVKYEDMLERNPRSQVFAPLAESYRKLGLVDKALSLFKRGIYYNPDYVMGHLGLAACYMDEGQPQMTYSTLRPIVESCRDNLKLQKLFAEACIKLDIRGEALDTYKYILFIYPRNQEAIEKIKELESKKGESLSEHSMPEVKPAKFDLSLLDSGPLSDSVYLREWVQVDLSEGELAGEDWSIEEPGVNPVGQGKFPPQTGDSHDDMKSKDEGESGLTPVMTHTLVDLYIQQGHLDRAREVLKKLLKTSKDNGETIKKWQELELLLEQKGAPSFEPLGREEERGRQNLMGLFEKASSQEFLPYKRKFESLLWNLHHAIQNKVQKLKD